MESALDGEEQSGRLVHPAGRNTGLWEFFYFLQKDVLRKISTEMSTLTTSGNAGGLVDDVERASASARLTCISTFRASV